MIFNTFIRGAFIVVWLYFPFGSRFCEGQNLVVSSCTGTQRNETLTNCVTTPCMDMKTIGIPPCTGTPGQPPKNGSFYSREGCQHLKFFWRDLHLQERLPKRQVREDIREMNICDMKRNHYN